MKQVFVTGAAGFFGSHLVEDLLKKGYKVTCLVRPTDKNLDFLKTLDVKLVFGDLFNPETYEGQIHENSNVFHSAGLTPGFKATRQKYFYVNVEGTRKLLEVCRGKRVASITVISSAASVGPVATKRDYIKENSQPRPESFYGESKLATEILFKKYYDEYFSKENVHCNIIRPFILYGPRMPKISGAANVFRIAKRRVVPIISGLNGSFEYCYVKDVVNGTLLAMERPGFNVYNISNTKKQSFEEVIRMIQRKSGSKVRIVKIPLPLAKSVGKIGDMIVNARKKKFLFSTRSLKNLDGNAAADCSKAINELGYEQKYSLEEGIELTLRYFK